jgi:hypothetical protein
MILTTFPPRSRTVWAADRPDKPPPTTMIFAEDMTERDALAVREK